MRNPFRMKTYEVEFQRTRPQSMPRKGVIVHPRTEAAYRYARARTKTGALARVVRPRGGGEWVVTNVQVID